jgi:hypothetical protein
VKAKWWIKTILGPIYSKRTATRSTQDALYGVGGAITHTSADRVDDECLCQDDHPHTSSTGEATRHWPGAREILRGETGKATAHNSLRLLEWERQVILASTAPRRRIRVNIRIPNSLGR